MYNESKKTKQTTKAILLCFFISFLSISTFAQKEIFKHLSSLTIANLNPTQIESYNKIKSQNIYSSIYFVSTNDIKTIADTGYLKITLPFLFCNNMSFLATSVSYTNSSNFYWVGKSFNDKDTNCAYGNFTLMKNNNKIIGHLILESRSYELFDLTGGVQVLCETDFTKIPKADCGTLSNEPSANKIAGNSCSDGKTKILVLYTPAAAAKEPDMFGRANLCISQLNENWSNSLIFNEVSLAGVQPLNFIETGDIAVDANNLPYNTTAQALRNTYKAEIVVLLTSNGYNGIVGRVPNGAIGTDYTKAFAIVDIAVSTTGRYTFAHEVSHLFGGRHDNDPSNSLFHGLKFKTGASILGIGGKHRATLMVDGANLGNTNDTRIEYTSNPSVQFLGEFTGDTWHNNANAVTDNKFSIGGFYSDPLPSPYVFDITKSAGCYSHEWFGRIEVCGNLSPLTYNWYSSINGFNWNLIATGTNPILSLFQSDHFVKCEVVSSSNVVLYSLQKTIVQFFCSGFAYKIAGKTQENDHNGSVKLYPNPTDKEVYLDIYATTEDLLSISIYNSNGQLVVNRENVTTKTGLNNLRLNLDLHKGLYTVRVVGKNSNFSEKLVIN